MPVTSRDGVTSNAGLAAGLPVGAVRTVADFSVEAAASHSGDLAGIPLLDLDLRQSVRDIAQSIVEEGQATQNGTLLSCAANALR